MPPLAWRLVRDPDGLDGAELRLLDRRRAACFPASTAYPLLLQIARPIREQDPSQRDAWLDAAARAVCPT